MQILIILFIVVYFIQIECERCLIKICAKDTTLAVEDTNCGDIYGGMKKKYI